MPHVSSGGGGDDLGSTDEVKVFKDEGEDEKRSSENLTEEKSSLIDLTESEEKSGSLPGQSYSSSKNATRSDHSPVFGKVEPTPHTSSFNMGYLVSPYPYPNGTAGPIPVSMASKMGLAPTHPGAALPFFCHNGEHLTQPPPAHMGIPPYQLDGKGAGAMGLTRPPMYPFSTGQYPYPMLSPEMSQVAASWHTPSMYPISTAGAGFRSPYPTSLPITSTSLSSDFYRFSPTGLLPAHPGLSPHSHPHSLASHPAIVTPGPKQELSAADHNHRMQLSKIHTMDTDSWCEPLNLVKKKTKPVAIVAPSSVIDKSLDKLRFSESFNSNIKTGENKSTEQLYSVNDEEIKRPCIESENGDQLREANFLNFSPLNAVRNFAIGNDGNNSQKQSYDSLLLKQTSNKEITATEATGNADKGQCSDVPNKSEKDSDVVSSVTTDEKQFVPKTFSEPPNLYSMIHDLAANDNKFLSALYMSRLIATAAPSLPSLPIPLSYHAPNYFTTPNYEMPVSPMTEPSNATSSMLLSNLLSFADVRSQLWQMPPNWQDISKIRPPASPNVVPSTPPVETQTINCNTPEVPPSSPIASLPRSPSKKSRASKKGSTALDQKNSTSSTTEGTKAQDSAQASNNQDKKKPHIKKPLNAFMLYMKEMRAKVVAECTLKESAAINQILGRRWHSLSREEQAKYYEKARQERQLHMQLYPGWSARDNYGYGAKKKKRKKERSADPGGNSMKKCRARYGLDQQNQWCKPCRRKKKCIRYMESGESADGNQSEDNLGSCGSAGEAHTPPDDDADGDGESLPHSLSSPGGLSGLSSLTSPSMILPSPGTSLASPSVSLASPCVSLQSPLTPHDPSTYECKPPVTNSLPLPLPPPSLHHHHHPPHQHHPPPGPQPHRNPVGTNPRDVNNPLSVNQLTGQCIKTEGSGTGQDSSSASRPVISVT